MDAKEKAQEIFDRMKFHIKWNAQPSTVNGVAKQCALVAVDEIINATTKILDGGEGWQLVESNTYWQEVKQELEKL
jgi:hypothetical protein